MNFNANTNIVNQLYFNKKHIKKKKNKSHNPTFVTTSQCHQSQKDRTAQDLKLEVKSHISFETQPFYSLPWKSSILHDPIFSPIKWGQ